MTQGLTILAMMVGGCAAATCPAGIKVLDTVDMTKYPGIWYEVASENLEFLSGCSCSRYHYQMTGNQTFDDHFSCTEKGKPAALSLTLKGQIPDLTKPAVQKESPLSSWLPTAPYLILELGKNYEYAVVYACVQLPFGHMVETTYIFARDSQALAKEGAYKIDFDGIKSRLKAQGIDPTQIKLVPQPTTCSYPQLDVLV